MPVWQCDPSTISTQRNSSTCTCELVRAGSEAGRLASRGPLDLTHRAEVGLEATVVAVVARVEPLREDRVDQIAALLVDNPPHLQALEEQGSRLREDFLAALVARGLGADDNLAVAAARQPALRRIAENVALGLPRRSSERYEREVKTSGGGSTVGPAKAGEGARVTHQLLYGWSLKV